MSFTELVLDPIYDDDTQAVDGIIAASTGKADQAFRVLDKTAAKDLGNVVTLETIVPSARIRATQLATNGLVRADLDKAVLTMNGKDWRIQSVKPRPSPGGEADGEYELFLAEERPR